jgi:hypothetical protein
MEISLKSICHFGNRNLKCGRCHSILCAGALLLKSRTPASDVEYTVVIAAFLVRKKIAVVSMTMLKYSNGLIRHMAPIMAPIEVFRRVQAYRPEQRLEIAAVYNLSFAALKVAPTNKCR